MPILDDTAQEYDYLETFSNIWILGNDAIQFGKELYNLTQKTLIQCCFL